MRCPLDRQSRVLSRAQRSESQPLFGRSPVDRLKIVPKLIGVLRQFDGIWLRVPDYVDENIGKGVEDDIAANPIKRHNQTCEYLLHTFRVSFP
ncbi:MAG: hypothetical protein ACKOB8_10130, partial [Mycobacterium sp.]